ncbi:ABC transporter permease [Frateuria hangzhouensis]|uniref:ABC transporter permease n=1 Tax=Frateuria hangzhouensis TaxID=2995589 RepID=UPI002260D1EB|nr:FtsX-like permease family protein [Frateuria sp. STR12]MCX7513674.1 ABC transporter permease [Frateuria sp. STR12]
MEIRPILASLRKHRIPALLIVLEIALACAVLCNAVFLIGARAGEIALPNAIDEQGLSVVTLTGADPDRAASEIPRNLDALRRIRGVREVAVLNTVPLSGNGWNSNFTTRPDMKPTDKGSINSNVYLMGEGAGRALGLRLTQGRMFTGEDYASASMGSSFMPETHVAIVNQRLAERLWPGQSPLGRKMYVNQYWYQVVGVVANVLRPKQAGAGLPGIYDAAFFPMQPTAELSYYVLRGAPADRERIARQAEDALSGLEPAAVAEGKTFVDIRGDYFSGAASMVWMLVLVCVVMLAVTAFGIVGLTSFWVAQRRRQIGIRRAVGARRGHILSYFRTENFLLSGAGVLLGMLLAFGINLYLMQHYEMARMPWYYLPAGAITLWLLGQVAVFGPAHRAAAVPPVEATRSA